MAPLPRSNNIIKRMKWAGHVPRMGDKKNAYIFVETSEGKRALTGPKHGIDDIKMNLRVNRCGLGKFGYG
jgi:hypothetical protein